MHRYRRGLICAALLLAAGVAHRAHAAPRGSVAVLGLEPVEVPESLTQSVTDAVRARATASGMRVVAARDFVELKMVFNCDNEAPSCLAQAGKSLGADLLVYGTLKRGPQGDVQVALKLLDVGSGSVSQFINESLPQAALEGVSLKSTSARWFNSLFGIEPKGKLKVVTDPAGASVSLDGQAVGEAPLDISDLAVGSHTLVFSKAGFVDVQQTVSISADDVTTAHAQLSAEPPQPAVLPNTTPAVPVTTPPQGHPGRTAKFLGLGAGVAAVVAAGVAIYTWRHYDGLETTAHNDLVAAQQQQPNPSSFYQHPGCSVPAGVAATAAGAKYKSDCDSGSSFANATTALWVVAGVLAAGGVASYIVGDRQAAHAREQAGRSPSVTQLLKQTLRIAPIATTSSGGISASFEF